MGWKDKATKVEAAPEEVAAAFAAADEAPAPAITEEEADAMRTEAQKKRIAARPTGEGSFGTGVKQGLTFSFADELAGVAGAAGDAYQAFRDDRPRDPEAYQTARDEERARLTESRQAEPFKTGVGQVAGGLLVPLGALGKAKEGATALQLAKTGAAIGAGSGAVAGVGEAKTAADVPWEVAKGTAFGTIAGAAAPALGQAAGSLAKGTANLLRKPLEAAGQRADELRLLTPASATGGAISQPRLLQEAALVPGGIPEAARVLRESGISSGITTAQGINQRAAAALEESGTAIGKILDDATERGAQTDIGAIVSRLRAAAAERINGLKGAGTSAQGESDALIALADRIEKNAKPGAMFDDGVIKDTLAATPRAAKDLAGELGQDAAQGYRAASRGGTPTSPAEAAMEGRRAVEEAIKKSLAEIGLDPAAYQASKTLNQVARISKDAGDVALGRADKNNLLSLGDMNIAQAAGGGAKGALAAAARQTLGPLSASTRATAAEASRDLAQRLAAYSPTMFSGAPQASGALGEATMGAAAANTPATIPLELSSEDQRLAADLRARGMPEEEIASILGVQQ
jgi:hypothetical protein